MTTSIPGYEQYVMAAADGRTVEAKSHLLTALRAAREKGGRPVVAGLVQRLGDLFHADGDQAAALALYEVSEDLDPGSLLVKLDHAKFLWNSLADAEASSRKCDEIIALGNIQPFPESDDDFSSEEYAAAATRLKDEIQAGKTHA